MNTHNDQHAPDKCLRRRITRADFVTVLVLFSMYIAFLVFVLPGNTATHSDGRTKQLKDSSQLRGIMQGMQEWAATKPDTSDVEPGTAPETSDVK